MTKADNSVRPRTLPAVALGLLALAHVIGTRLVWSGIPLQRDAGIWAYMGSRLLEGARLYRDLWDQKPPGIYYTFAGVERLFGVRNVQALVWLDAAVTVLVLAVTYRVARRFASATASAAGVLILAIIYGHRVLADWGDNCEKFVALFEMIALWIVMSDQSRDREGASRDIRGALRRSFTVAALIGLFAAGAACGVASLYKQTGILFLLAASLHFALDSAISRPSAKARPIVILWLGFLAVWTPVLLGLTEAGTLRYFWQDVVVYDFLRISPEGEGGRLATPEHWSQVWESFKLVIVLFAPALLVLVPRRPGPDGIASMDSGIRIIMVYWLFTTAAFAVAPNGWSLSPPAAAARDPRGDDLRSSNAERRKPAVEVRICRRSDRRAAQLGDHFRFMLDPNHTYRALIQRSEILGRFRDRDCATIKARQSVMICRRTTRFPITPDGERRSNVRTPPSCFAESSIV
jgi:hypothetical protein